MWKHIIQKEAHIEPLSIEENSPCEWISEVSPRNTSMPFFASIYGDEDSVLLG